MNLKVVTREGVLVDRDVVSVRFVTPIGGMEVLPGHAPLVVLVNPGKIFHNESETEIGAGVAWIKDDKILIMAEGGELVPKDD